MVGIRQRLSIFLSRYILELTMGFVETSLTVAEEEDVANIHIQSNIPLQDSGVLIEVVTESITAGLYKLYPLCG